MSCEMTCQIALGWIEPFLDDHLDVATAHTVVQHLSGCPACSRKFEIEGNIRRQVKRGLTKEIEAPAGLWERFLHRVLHLPAPIGLVQLVDAAAKYHGRLAGELRIAGASESDILSYYRGAAGYLPCPGHVDAIARAGAPWESAAVLRDEFPGRSLAWKNYRDGGMIVSQVSVPRDYVGVLNAGELRFPYYTFARGKLSISVADCPAGICTFVSEGEEAADRVRKELYRDYCFYQGASKPTFGKPMQSEG